MRASRSISRTARSWSLTGRVIPFKIDARRQHALLNGLDDIAQTMTHKDKVEARQATDKNARPWVWL